ncbi:MAG: hypothetical protein EON59_00750 [Alphaproteobacteria bacterium]|nr:MAG: hypothetical protein EON59_00750 [Alphaproteobacteria bacterium]
MKPPAFPTARVADPVARFLALASDVRTKLELARDGADPLTRTEIAGLLGTLAYYEGRATCGGSFAAIDADSGLIRFGRNGYGPLIDGLAAQSVRRGGVDSAVLFAAARDASRALSDNQLSRSEAA